MSDPAPTRAVLFDAVGTLFHPRTSVGEIYRDVAAAHGVDSDAVQLEERFQALARARGTPVDRDGWRDRVRAVFPTPERFRDFDAFFLDVFAAFRSGQGWQAYPETRGVLERLQRKGLELGVVTNFDDRVVEVLADLELAAFFGTVQTPQSSGFRKPQPGIFRCASIALGVSPADTLMVGDDPVDDLEGSRRAGMRGLLVDRRDEPGQASFIIHDLRPLPKILVAS